jgi:hypothetical protein
MGENRRRKKDGVERSVGTGSRYSKRERREKEPGVEEETGVDSAER